MGQNSPHSAPGAALLGHAACASHWLQAQRQCCSSTWVGQPHVETKRQTPAVCAAGLSLPLVCFLPDSWNFFTRYSFVSRHSKLKSSCPVSSAWLLLPWFFWGESAFYSLLFYCCKHSPALPLLSQGWSDPCQWQALPGLLASSSTKTGRLSLSHQQPLTIRQAKARCWEWPSERAPSNLPWAHCTRLQQWLPAPLLQAAANSSRSMGHLEQSPTQNCAHQVWNRREQTLRSRNKGRKQEASSLGPACSLGPHVWGLQPGQNHACPEKEAGTQEDGLCAAP